MISLEADVVIVGAGIAGCSAAIAAAKENKNVLIIEKSDSLGGNATQSNVGTICGAYYRTFSEYPRIAGYSFSTAFLDKLISMSVEKTPKNYHKGLYILSYEWSVLQSFLEMELLANGIRIMKSSEIIRVDTKMNSINRLIIASGEESLEILPKAVIDCSGNGVVSQLAGLEMIASPSYQSASQIFRVKGVLSDSEFSLNMSLKKTMSTLVKKNNWPLSFNYLSVVPGSLKNKQADFKITFPDTITDQDDRNNELYLKGRTSIETVFPSLTEEVESLRSAYIENIFPKLGIRTLQRSKGKYILTESDVLSCKKTESGIAIGTWPIEEWQSDGNVSMEYFEPDDGYMIPADCLISFTLDNLYFAGKNISATTKAIASARVMGTCLQTGYAAGKIATCETSDEQKEMIALLNKELLFGNE
jgi:hypothetical protein